MTSKTPKKTETMPEIPNMIRDILSTIGLSSECRVLPDSGGQTGWEKYRFPKADGSDAPVPVLLFEHKAKAISDAKSQVSGIFHCVALFHLKSSYSIFFKSGSYSAVFGLDSNDACEQIQTVLSTADFASADSKVKSRLAIRKTIENIPTTTSNFNNRGVFSTHYLKGRLLRGTATQRQTALRQHGKVTRKNPSACWGGVT